MPKLLVVATPIGNLGDLSPNMREALSSCDLIAAEDTRMTMKLLHRFEIKKPLVSCHRHNEGARASELIERMLREDLTVALTTDAGTPAISDPGHALVNAAWEAGIPVSPVAGPSAVAAALSVSGFDAKAFAFYGFPPREKKALDQALDSARDSGVPVAVYYESPHRVTALVGRIAERFPECMVAVFCDLTKKFEWMRRGSPADVLQALNENPNLEKGEYCVVLDLGALPPVEPPPSAGQSAVAVMAERLFAGATIDEAEDFAQRQGFPRNQIYKAKLFLKNLE